METDPVYRKAMVQLQKDAESINSVPLLFVPQLASERGEKKKKGGSRRGRVGEEEEPPG